MNTSKLSIHVSFTINQKNLQKNYELIILQNKTIDASVIMISLLCSKFNSDLKRISYTKTTEKRCWAKYLVCRLVLLSTNSAENFRLHHKWSISAIYSWSCSILTSSPWQISKSFMPPCATIRLLFYADFFQTVSTLPLFP